MSVIKYFLASTLAEEEEEESVDIINTADFIDLFKDYLQGSM